jgi:DNA-directed RNA polymerase alpha subunit
MEKGAGKKKKTAASEEPFDRLSAPARRALIHAGIKTVKKLSMVTEKEVLKLHGMGPASIPTLKAILKENGLFFKQE